jgi:hypothetical protein
VLILRLNFYTNKLRLTQRSSGAAQKAHSPLSFTLGIKNEAFMKLSDDKTTLHLSLNVSLSVYELDTLLSKLCELRAEMKV